jgi:hypothetical protein
MPSLSAAVQRRANDALALAVAADATLTEAARYEPLRQHWHVSRVEILYEIAYLRMFVEWELFLEAALLRYVCGYASASGVALPAAGATLFTSLKAAESDLLSGKAYLLWHNVTGVIARCQRYLSGSLYESVLATNRSRLEQYAYIRHRITHGQTDARAKFDSATEHDQFS